jgi:3-methyl-2-oxobutanoate hydroxymethyltransferase
MKLTVKDIVAKKKKGEKIVSLTAYDYSLAALLDASGVDLILIGDSLGMVCLGYESTLPVTMREMLHHTKAVSRAVRRALLVGDMPFGAVQAPEKALRNATRFLKEGGADAVKVEGGGEVAGMVRELRRAGIPVMGHLGLTPQRASELGGYKVQGQTEVEARKILEDARALEEAGVFSIVLECVPSELAKRITDAVACPTIGIGAGPHCDGQILVLYDLLGIQEKIRPRFVRTYAPVGEMIREAVGQYRIDVLRGDYPSIKESFSAAGDHGK